MSFCHKCDGLMVLDMPSGRHHECSKCGYRERWETCAWCARPLSDADSDASVFASRGDFPSPCSRCVAEEAKAVRRRKALRLVRTYPNKKVWKKA